MTIQNIFYICGISVFVLTSTLLIAILLGYLGISKKIKNILETIEDGMESNVVGTIIQLVPLMAAIFTEITDRRSTKRKRGRKKRK